jgi:hypothetical protein
VTLAGRHDNCLAGPGDDRLEPELELHRSGPNLEALLLLGMNMGARDAPVGGQREVDGEQLAVGIGRGLDELDGLAADRVAENLSSMCHEIAPGLKARRPIDSVEQDSRSGGRFSSAARSISGRPRLNRGPPCGGSGIVLRSDGAAALRLLANL